MRTSSRSRATAAILLLASLASPAVAAGSAPPARTTTLVVYGKDACPVPVGDEIIVCARKPEGDRYRIPKELRQKKGQLSESSWVSQVAALEEATRFTRPNSCSVVGSGGQTGCFDAMIRQWYAGRRADRAEAATIP